MKTLLQISERIQQLESTDRLIMPSIEIETKEDEELKKLKIIQIMLNDPKVDGESFVRTGYAIEKKRLQLIESGHIEADIWEEYRCIARLETYEWVLSS